MGFRCFSDGRLGVAELWFYHPLITHLNCKIMVGQGCSHAAAFLNGGVVFVKWHYLSSLPIEFNAMQLQRGSAAL